MLVGIFADTHDHLDNLRRVVAWCNAASCDQVLFAGDLVSTFVIPALRKLEAPLIGCFGDNEGNKVGIYGGMSIIGSIGEPPLGVRLEDGTRVLLTHQKELLSGGLEEGADVVVFSHTHKPLAALDSAKRLWINPGEASGWTYGRATMAFLETTFLETTRRAVRIVDIDEGPPGREAVRTIVSPPARSDP